MSGNATPIQSTRQRGGTKELQPGGKCEAAFSARGVVSVTPYSIQSAWNIHVNWNCGFTIETPAV